MYEFGRKASVTMLRDSGVIVWNLYDGDTLEPALEQASEMTGKTCSVLVTKAFGTEVVIGKD